MLDARTPFVSIATAGGCAGDTIDAETVGCWLYRRAGDGRNRCPALRHGRVPARHSHIATAFICGVVGQETGIEPDALVWVIRMMKNTGADAKHTGRLLADAAVWMSSESAEIDLMKMWVGECKGPMAVLGEAFGD